MAEKKELAALGKELNELLFDEPQIDVKDTVKKMTSQIEEASELLEAGDEQELTKESIELMVELDCWPLEVPKELDTAEEEDVPEEPDTPPAEEEEYVPEEEDDGDEENEEREEPKKKAKKKKKQPKKPGRNKKTGPKVEIPKKPRKKGVIAIIAEAINEAGEEGITKEEIHKILVNEFPERDPNSMMATVKVQVPTRINKERFEIGSTEDGHYFRK